MAGKTKTCKRCGADKPLAEFTKVSRNADGLNIWCRPCVKIRSAELKAAKGKPGSTRAPKTLADGKPAAPNGVLAAAQRATKTPAPVLEALAQINANIAAADAKPAKKTLTREQKDAANARAKAKRDEAREMRAAALEARS